jgi:hypothetical protein
MRNLTKDPILVACIGIDSGGVFIVTVCWCCVLQDHLPVFTQPDVEKWPEPENGTANNCKEVLCIRKCAGQKVLMCLLFYLPAKSNLFS